MVRLAPRLWLVSDTPGRGLWLVAAGQARFLALGDAGWIPTGLAWEPPMLWVGDLQGRVWQLEVDEGFLAGLAGGPSADGA